MNEHDERKPIISDNRRQRETVLIRPAVAAELLSLSLSEVYSLCRAGVLPVCRVGRAVRIHRGRLLEWCEKQVSEPESEQ